MSLLKRWQGKIIPRLITAILLCSGDPHFAGMARTIAMAKRHRSSVMRFFKTKRFKSRADYRRTLNAVIRSSKKLSKSPWFIVLDGTSTKRGGLTKIMNAIKYRPKDTSHKGCSTKAHMFLMGTLLLPNGMRLPLPRMSYYTKEYCTTTKRKHVTIVQLAVEMIKQAPVPKKAKVIVLADEYFEGKDLHNICTQLGYSYIMPVDSRRCFADRYGNRLKETLHERGLRLSRRPLEKISFVSGKEETASYRRMAKANLKRKRVYHACAEVRSVAGLGNVLVTYSRKQKNKKGKKQAETYRVFVSNNRALSAKNIVEYYELRWQIELFFRELKSVIGLDRFRGSDFQSFERYVDVILMSFLFLECYRIESLKKNNCRKQKAMIARTRTHGLITMLQREVNKESVDFVMRLSKKKGGRKKLYEIIHNLLDAA
jgi:hypothetical protein